MTVLIKQPGGNGVRGLLKGKGNGKRIRLFAFCQHHHYDTFRGAANFFYEGPGSKYLRLCGQFLSKLANSATAAQKQLQTYVNKWVRLYFNKTL